MIFFGVHFNEPQKNHLKSSLNLKKYSFYVNDLKSFLSVESNPHFFKWDKELNVTFFQFNNVFTNIKFINIYF